MVSRFVWPLAGEINRWQSNERSFSGRNQTPSLCGVAFNLKRLSSDKRKINLLEANCTSHLSRPITNLLDAHMLSVDSAPYRIKSLLTVFLPNVAACKQACCFFLTLQFAGVFCCWDIPHKLTLWTECAQTCVLKGMLFWVPSIFRLC